ncbi:hypothetical protein [Microbacterium halotolerans]|uniref:hypothetical protein n=1 Tax=Microbacterium halotolerans TaxID=246613 RepID=UPI000E6ACAD9|nr:hypothetical protein [Microbacterium halotolerans]
MSGASHRSTARRRVLSTLAAAALFVLALSLGRVVSDQLSDSSASAAPFSVAAAASEGTVSLDYVDVTVKGVRATDTLVDREEVETTTATFLVVDLEVLAPARSLHLGGLRLRGADGTIYRPAGSSRTGCSDATSIATGLPTYWMACFEIPDDAVRGATMLLGRGDPESGLDRREQRAEIDLELDEERAEALTAASDPLPTSLADMEPYDIQPVEVEQ